MANLIHLKLGKSEAKYMLLNQYNKNNLLEQSWGFVIVEAQFNSRGWPIPDSQFIIFMFSNSGGMKFAFLVEDSDSAYYFG